MINNMIFLVSGVPNDSLAEFFAALRRNPDVAGYLQVPYNECEFHRLTSPASLARNGSEDDDTILARVTRACSDASNRIRLSPTITTVGELTDNGMFASNCVYLVIDFQDPQLESLNAIRQLRRDHGNLFTCLQVTASSVKAWHEEDVDRNLQGGEVRKDIGRLPREFRQIQDALDKKRVYHSTIYDLFSRRQDLASALKYRTQFDRVFKHGLPLYDVAAVTSDAEFSAFYSVLRRVASDMSTILDKGTTSSVKSSIFTFCFVQPPFFFEIHDDSHGFRYKEEQSWSFPLFVDTPSMRDDWKTYTPRNDCMVVSPQHGIPFIISEVISDVKESDCWRMLVEASALARAGQFLLKSTSKKRFFIVALYVDANMVVSRYIVMQSGDNNVGHKLVSIYQKSFDLKKANEQADFMREMYNLTTQITALSGELDQDKRLSLRDIHAVAGNVPSLSSAPQKTRTTGSTTAERTAGTHGPQDEDNLGVFEADDIKNVLHQMNYKIEFVLRRHPQLASIVNKTGEKHGYLKFVEREKEVKVLQYLTEIDSVSNHTISGVRFWPVEGGTMISMPVAGGQLTALENPDEHLWSVSLQLVEGVAFMHEHNVAHMDLKPQNVIVPVEGGHLSIIDFSVSSRVPGPDTTYSGVVGTEDYIAPEVHKGNYKPMLADLWSCGKTLEELCARCRPSADRTKVLEIAGRLMDGDPEARPKMSTVLEWMTPTT